MYYIVNVDIVLWRQLQSEHNELNIFIGIYGWLREYRRDAIAYLRGSSRLICVLLDEGSRSPSLEEVVIDMATWI